LSINIKTAVAAATKYVGELFDGAADIRLEEVERSGDYPNSRDWLITLSFSLPKIDAPLSDLFVGAYAQIFGTAGRLPRHYKVFRVDDDSGEVVSMKIRTPPVAK
jgi:hypothetical protein